MGQTRYIIPPLESTREQRQWKERMIVFKLAGPAAQMRVNPAWELVESSGEEDFAEARYFAAQVISADQVADSTGLYRAVWALQAAAFVERHWSAVEALAAALLDRQYLRERALRQVIAAALAR